MDSLYALIASGDISARDNLSHLLGRLAGLTVVETCETALGVTRALRTHTVNLVLLDAALPPDGGEAVMERLEDAESTVTVVTGAVPGDGLWAYTLGAADCLPNPISPKRLQVAVERARERILDAEIRGHCSELRALLKGESSPPAETQGRPLVVRSGSQLIFVEPSEVDWIEASGVYVRVHVGSAEYLVRETLRNVEQQLDSAQFVRVHRSTILNVSRVRKIVPHFNGGAVVMLKDGTQLKMSRSYREQIHASIG